MLQLNTIPLLLILLFCISCGNPNDPESIGGNDGGYKIVSKFQTPGFAQDVIVDGSLAYIVQGEGGLIIVDISNPAEPDTVSMLFDGVRGYSSKISKKDSVVYLAAGSFGVSVVEVADAFNPSVSISNLNMKPATDFCLMGNYLFTAVGEKGIQVAEISFPPQPDIRGTMHTPGYAHGIEVKSDSSSIVAACGEMGIAVMDIANFQDGFGTYPIRGWLDLPGYSEDIVLIENDNFACLACGTDGIQIVDISDSSNYNIVGGYSTGGYAKEIKFKNNKLFVSTGQRGLQIISVANLSSPTFIGTVQTENARGFDMDDNYIYVADEEEGLVIISIPN